MKIVVFDWSLDGHHLVYAQRFSEALAQEHEVFVALPDGADPVIPPDVTYRPLGPGRPAGDVSQPLRKQRRETVRREVELMREAVADTQADHIVHLYADPILRSLAVSRDLGALQTICLHFPRAHYPSAYGTPLVGSERVKARIAEGATRVWTRRAFAHAVLMWEDVPVASLNAHRGAPAFELPEPPLGAAPKRTGDRHGIVLYGALRRSKGIDLLAAAVTSGPIELDIVIAGPVVEQGYEAEIVDHVDKMRAAGARVDARIRPHTQEEGLATLAAACCAVLPYARHPGHSRTLVEAAAAGTPVVAHDRGLLGHTVRRHGLGVIVDCFDVRALRAAITSLTEDETAPDRYAEALSAFAARSTQLAFGEAVRAPFRSQAAGAPSPRIAK